MAGNEVLGLLDPAVPIGTQVCAGVSVIGDDSYLDTVDPSEVGLTMGVGWLPGGNLRRDLFERLVSSGWEFPEVLHPAACVSRTCMLADGVQVMAGAIIQAAVFLGRNTIINTGAIVEHDVSIGAHVHVAPGATICGDVHVGDAAFIGAGVTIVQGVQIGAEAVIAAGATVVNNVAIRQRVGGTPARSF